MVSQSSTARNLGVILDDGLSCAPNITAVAWSCRFALYNIRRIRSFLTKGATQLLVQVLVISRLAELPASDCTIAACLVYNLAKLPSDSPSSMTSTGFLLRWWCWPLRLAMELHPSTSKHWSDHMSQESTSLFHISWPAGTSITQSNQWPLSKDATLLCFGTSVVEQTTDQCQDSAINLHLPQKTQDSFFQTSPWLCIARLPKVCVLVSH